MQFINVYSLSIDHTQIIYEGFNKYYVILCDALNNSAVKKMMVKQSMRLKKF